jgi:glyoxylase-like metal-dependent hydrolase (beta-lactamase superfamily II)
MRGAVIPWVVVLVFLAYSPGTITAQNPAENAEGLKILRKGLDALGGETKIRSLRSIYFSAKGTENGVANGQAYQPDKDSPTAHEEKLAVFNDGKRLAYEYKTDRGDGTTRWRRFYFNETQRLVADLGNRTASAAPAQFPNADRDQDARRIPHMLLLETLSASTSVTSPWVRSYDGREQDVISVMLPNTKIPVSIYFDKKTGLLTKYEYTAELPALGQSVVEYIFSGYREHPKLTQFPAAQIIKVNGKIWRSVKIDKAMADSSEADAMLEVSPEMEGFLIPPGTVKQVAKGVYYVYGLSGFQPMFVEFKDFVVAIEAPANHPSLEETPLETIGDINSVSREFIAKIRETVKNKPIKYVVITHCHSDHMGGLRAFIPENPTVLTSPGNKAFYEKFAPELKVDIFSGKKVITDGERTVELINVGKNPHTEENIIVWFPEEKYLFQGDLFYFNNEPSFPPKDRMTVMPFFANWLKTNDLAPARIYGFHGPLFATMEHVEKVLKISAEKRN